MQGAFEGVNGVAFSSDSKLVLAADNKQARCSVGLLLHQACRPAVLPAKCGLWRLPSAAGLWADGRSSLQPRLAPARSDQHPTHSSIAAWTTSLQAVRVWDVATGRLRHSLTGHSGKVVGVACR